MSGCSTITKSQPFTVPAYTPPSPTQQPPASAPSVSAGASTESSVTLNYGQVSSATGYEYNDTAGGDQRFNRYTGSFDLVGLSPGQTIQARARAFNAAGNGPWSNYVTLTAQSATVSPAALTIISANIPAINPGQYAQATVTVANYGGQAGSATVSGTTYQNGVVQGYWTSASVTVQPNHTAAVTLQSAGAISSLFAGTGLPVTFALSTGGTFQSSLEVNSVPITSGPSVQQCMNQGVVLQYGSSGGCVTALQSALNSIAQYYGNGCGQISVDGNFGSATQQAVRCFQSWAGISIDGVVGQATWQQIYIALTGGQ